MIVFDNGTELTANAVLKWAQGNCMQCHHIALGRPIQPNSRQWSRPHCPDRAIRRNFAKGSTYDRMKLPGLVSIFIRAAPRDLPMLLRLRALFSGQCAIRDGARLPPPPPLVSHIAETALDVEETFPPSNPRVGARWWNARRIPNFSVSVGPLEVNGLLGWFGRGWGCWCPRRVR